ncbi:MAG: 4-(cytidine 5'-diphospho)-2-C-methyl-D-erythritol kinase [Erysipelotrichaceae bacterium]|nr:4-(cytidine 5'-diphospho)-2-C-methyl-D-erythritol kinase [Erysipelotrichaceae bacterium]
MIEKAYAKLNLSLNVVRKRSDGYHELEMVMVPLELHDTLEAELAETTTLTGNEKMPMDESNTILKAIRVLRDRYHFTENFRVTVQKRIPMQAGLAGGSSDGAAMLRLLNRLLHLDICEEELCAIGKEIGADVPFCVAAKPAVVKGIGEQLEFFEIPGQWHVLLVKPEEGVSTKRAFESLVFDENLPHPDPYRVKEALLTQKDGLLKEHMLNTLESSAVAMVPVIATIKKECEELGLQHVLMSGSGSTVFALSRKEETVKKAYDRLKEKYAFVCVTKVLN